MKSAGGRPVVAVYEGAGGRGAEGRDERPAFGRMLRDATRGEVTVDRRGMLTP